MNRGDHVFLLVDVPIYTATRPWSILPAGIRGEIRDVIDNDHVTVCFGAGFAAVVIDRELLELDE